MSNRMRVPRGLIYTGDPILDAEWARSMQRVNRWVRESRWERRASSALHELGSDELHHRLRVRSQRRAPRRLAKQARCADLKSLVCSAKRADVPGMIGYPTMLGDIDDMADYVLRQNEG